MGPPQDLQVAPPDLLVILPHQPNLVRWLRNVWDKPVTKCKNNPVESCYEELVEMNLNNNVNLSLRRNVGRLTTKYVGRSPRKFVMSKRKVAKKWCTDNKSIKN